MDQDTNGTEANGYDRGNRPLTGQLAEIRDRLRDAFPRAKSVLLEFDGTFRAHIDVREGELVPAIEAQLAHIDNGRFTQVEHGATPHHPFLHRISAVIEA
ncbi:hypothetical protein HT136_23580 [Novosphingobium profundi]|uniref:hypothetical protein n=1 Tax=Novosphingobium profundi TaxID=1774954 RepID=UPI001BDABE08|nr:hypothetical protein [Novosphingobium profundi]MBT0671356.1 hypothetical protein [Novosphingobium profundi]